MDYLEVNALYHHGIKGMKWGVINEKDPAKYKTQAQKDKLNYEKSVNKQNKDYKTNLLKNKQDFIKNINSQNKNYEKSISLGKMELSKHLSTNATERKEIKANHTEEMTKIRNRGKIAIASILVVGIIGGKLVKNLTKDKVTKENTTKRIAIRRGYHFDHSGLDDNNAYDDYDDDELSHHGVKGMKWGIINKKDPAEYKVKAQKNLLDYDRKTDENEMNYKSKTQAKKLDYKIKDKSSKLDYNRSIKLGEMQLTAALADANNERLKAKKEAEVERKRIATKGKIAILAILAGIYTISKFGMPGTNNKKTINNIGGNYTKTTYNNQQRNTSIAGTVSEIIGSRNRVRKNSLGHSDDDIFHAGILGMKWGIRRYQKEDGTLTEEGKARYGYLYDKYKYIVTDDDKSKIKNKAIDKWNKENKGKKLDENSEEFKKMHFDVANDFVSKKMSETNSKVQSAVEEDVRKKNKMQEDVLNDSSKLANQVANLIPANTGQKVHPDYSDIPTEELINRTRRLQAETSYAQAAGEYKYIKSGKDKVREALQFLGSSLAIGLTAVQIKNAVDERHMHKKKDK